MVLEGFLHERMILFCDSHVGFNLWCLVRTFWCEKHSRHRVHDVSKSVHDRIYVHVVVGWIVVAVADAEVSEDRAELG